MLIVKDCYVVLQHLGNVFSPVRQNVCMTIAYSWLQQVAIKGRSQ